jgi:hypothetical protein
VSVSDSSVLDGPAFVLDHLLVAFRHWMHHLDEMVVGDAAVTGDSVSSHLLVECLLDTFKATLCQRFSIWILIRRLSRPVQCCDVVPALPFGDQFCAIAIT